MTLNDINYRIYENLGEPTDLDPATVAGLTLITWVGNEAQRQVAKWKDKNTGRINYLPSLIRTINYLTTTITGSVSSYTATTPSLVVTSLLSAIGTGTGRYDDYVLEMTSGDADGEVRYITHGNGTTFILNEAFTNAPAAADTFNLYKNYEYIKSPTLSWYNDHFRQGVELTSDLIPVYIEPEFFEILSLVDINQGVEITYADENEKFSGDLLSFGRPTQWYRHGNKLVYNIAANESFPIRMEYYKMPTDMTLITDTPEIPEEFHYAMILWGTWWGHVRAMESSKSYSLKMDFEDEMRKTLQGHDVRKERLDLKGVVIYD